MSNQTPLVPGQPAFDVTVYIVLNYFGSRLGPAYCETGEDEVDENTTIENILSGQYSRIRSGWSPSTPPKAGHAM